VHKAARCTLPRLPLAHSRRLLRNGRTLRLACSQTSTVAYLSVPHTGLPRRRRAEGGVAAGGWLLVDGGIQAGGSLALLILDLLAASADSLLSRYLARNSSYNCAYLDSIYCV
jgi:hypothetical protein